MDTLKVSKFLELKARAHQLDVALKEVKDEMYTVEISLLGEFEKDGVDSVKLNGQTVYIHRQLWAKAMGGDKAKACEVLRSNGLTHFLEEKFNTHSVSAWFREMDQTGSEVPEEILEAFDVSEVFQIRVRKE
jgi:hypothetical protein